MPKSFAFIINPNPFRKGGEGGIFKSFRSVKDSSGPLVFNNLAAKIPDFKRSR
jgi:hypothetical protein